MPKGWVRLSEHCLPDICECFTLTLRLSLTLYLYTHSHTLVWQERVEDRVPTVPYPKSTCTTFTGIRTNTRYKNWYYSSSPSCAKYRKMFKTFCSFCINSCSLSIFTLASFKSSTEDNVFVKGFCKDISCNCSFSFVVKLCPLGLKVILPLVSYYVPKRTRHIRNHVLNIPCNVEVNTISHGFLKSAEISVSHNTVNSSVVVAVNNSLLKCKGIQYVCSKVNILCSHTLLGMDIVEG
jgi:hypothetical protein